MATVDYEARSTAKFLPGVNVDRYDLIARFRDQGSAAQAVDGLRGMGFTESDVSIIGNTGDAVSSSSGLARSDAKVAGSSFRLSMLGIGAGAVLGAIIGVIVLALPPVQSALGTPVHGAGYAAAAIIGAIIGLTLGGLVGGIQGLDRNQSGEHSYDMQTGGGDVLVGVCTSEQSRLDQAGESLQRAGALNVERHTPAHVLTA